MGHIIKLFLAILLFAKLTKQDENTSRTTEYPEKNTVKTYRACIFDGNVYGHGEQVDVKEPCLNCSCNHGLLACYRKACPPFSIRPECKLEKRPNICCPAIECGNKTEDFLDEILGKELHGVKNSTDVDQFLDDVTETFEDERINETDYMFDQNITEFDGEDETSTSGKDYSLTSDPTTIDPFDEPIHSNIIRESRKQDDDSFNLIFATDDQLRMPQHLPHETCFYRGSIYSEGSAMESDELCQYCFCLGGSRRCMKSKCNLQIPGCIAEYDYHSSCCPKSYNCMDIKEIPITTTSTTKAILITNCWVENVTYSIGDRIYKANPCEICYCTTSGIECDHIFCDPPDDQSCTPVQEEGECCPVAYNCSKNLYGDNGDDHQTFLMDISQNKSTLGQDLAEDTFPGIVPFDETGVDTNATIYEGNSESEISFNGNSRMNESFTRKDEEEMMSASMLSTIVVNIKNNLSQLLNEFYGRNETSAVLTRGKLENDTKPLNTAVLNHLEEHKTSASFELEQNVGDESLDISLNNGDVNDTVMALLLEHVFGSNNENTGTLENNDYANKTDIPHKSGINGHESLENHTEKYSTRTNEKKEPVEKRVSNDTHVGDTKSQIKIQDNAAEIKPAFLSVSLLDDISDGNSLNDELIPQQNKKSGSTIIPTTLNEQKYQFISTTTRPAGSKYQPQFIDSSSLLGINKPDDDNGFSDRILEDSVSQPVRENDRLINILDIEHALGKQFDLRKIPPHLLSTIKSPPQKPFYKKANKNPLFKNNKPSSLFGPPPTLPPKLVASLMSMFKPAQYANNRVNRGDFSAKMRYQQDPAGTKEVFERGRKKETAQEEKASQTKSDIKFIPFVAADAVGLDGNSEPKITSRPSADDILDYMTDKAHKCTVGDKTFDNGDHIPRADPCVTCRCLFGQILCKKEKCSPTPPGCSSIKMDGDCCPVHSCGEGLVQVVNNNNYQKKKKDNVKTDKVNGENNSTDDKIENFDSVFEVIDRNNISNVIHNPFKEEASKFHYFQFSNQSSTPAAPPTTTLINNKDAQSTEETKTENSKVKTTLKQAHPDLRSKDENKELKRQKDDEEGAYVASVDVVHVGKQPSSETIDVETSANNEQTYSVGSVLRFGVDDSQQVVEDGGILTSGKEPDFNPYDVLSDLFVPEDEDVNHPTNSNKVLKDWSTSIKDESLSPVKNVIHATRKPEIISTQLPQRTMETTRRTASKAAVTDRTTKFSRTTKQPNMSVKTTIKFRRPITTATRRTTTSTTTTNKPIIDIAKSTVAGHFLDPWGLLKLSGCSYKGKTFMVGADIPELGSRCKKCSCISMGVVCQELNC